MSVALRTVCISLDLVHDATGRVAWEAVAPLEWDPTRKLDAMLEHLDNALARYGQVVRCEWHCNDTNTDRLLSGDVISMHPDEVFARHFNHYRYAGYLRVRAVMSSDEPKTDFMPLADALRA